MKFRKLTVATVATVLSAGALALPQAKAEVALSDAAAPAASSDRKIDQVVFRNGTLTTTSTIPGSNAVLPEAIVVGATARHDIRNGRLEMTATLAGPPVDSGYGSSGVDITMGIGEFDAFGNCETRTSSSHDTLLPAPEVGTTSQWSRVGNTISMTLLDSSAAGSTGYDSGYNCMVAATYYYDYDAGTSYKSGLQGTMADDYGVPNLQVPTKKINLAKKTTSLIPIEVTNIGTSSAGVVISGKGKGVKVVNTKVELVSSTVPAVAWLPIKLKGKKVKKVKLKMTSVGKTSTVTLRAKAVNAPAKPKPGRYGGGVANFVIGKGAVPTVQQFTGSISVACGSAATQNLDFQFPLDLRVWPNGQVQGQTTVDEGVIQMQMIVKGKRAGQGYLRYQDAGVGCEGETNFSAQRLGAS